MKRLLGLLLVMGMVGCGGAVAELEKLGAKITKDDQGQVIRVNLYATRITDAGLVHLKGLTNLERLLIGGNEINDTGLAHLKQLANLERLFLDKTQITDVGLGHLKSLANLKTLGLAGTKVTDAGIAELQKALPNCKITK